MKEYVLTMAIVSLGFSVAWSREGWGNIWIKLALAGLAVWGFVLRFGQW